MTSFSSPGRRKRAKNTTALEGSHKRPIMTQTDKSTLPKDFAEPPHWVHKQRACRTSPNDDEAPMTAEKKKTRKRAWG